MATYSPYAPLSGSTPLTVTDLMVDDPFFLQEKMMADNRGMSFIKR
jgi:hypothetical protein